MIKYIAKCCISQT